MKYQKIITFFYLSIVCALSSATISFDSTTSIWEDSTGSGLSDGSQILIGNFDTSGAFDFSLVGTDPFNSYSEVLPFFTQYGADTTETFGGNVSGIQLGGLGTVSNSAGSQIYFWAFNDSTLDSATEWAIVSNTDNSWLVPADPVPGSTSIELGAFTGTRSIEFGSLSSNLGPQGSTEFNIQLTAVPEPSTYALLAGIFSLGYIAVRRSRKFDEAEVA